MENFNKTGNSIRLISIMAFVVGAAMTFFGLAEYEVFLFVGLIVMGAAIILLADYYFAREFYKAACMKGHFEGKYFWISFICGATGVFGFIGYLLVIALPDKNKIIITKETSSDTEELPDI